jgi:hypothetical protein
LDEGQFSVPLESSNKKIYIPNIQYRVHDDYTIMSMIESGLGISILSKLILSRSPYHVATLELSPPIIRNISLHLKTKKYCPLPADTYEFHRRTVWSKEFTTALYCRLRHRILLRRQSRLLRRGSPPPRSSIPRRMPNRKPFKYLRSK